MFRTLARQAAQSAAKPAPSRKTTSAYVQRMAQLYPPKKVWPPDFMRLSPQEQLRLEKKYKRRLQLATANPKWVKFTKLAQLFGIVFVLIYSVLFMDFKGEQPFDNVRRHFWNALGMDYVPAAQPPAKTPSSLPQARS
ncbi:unnamed protein product [Discula destructiva]